MIFAYPQIYSTMFLLRIIVFQHAPHQDWIDLKLETHILLKILSLLLRQHQTDTNPGSLYYRHTTGLWQLGVSPGPRLDPSATKDVMRQQANPEQCPWVTTLVYVRNCSKPQKKACHFTK